MPWVFAALAAIGVYFVGKSRGWFGSPPIVCDIESDMPDAMKQQVLTQIAANKDPQSLIALATTLSGANYIQSAYCLMNRAWVLSGKQGPAPTPPTTAQIQAAQAARAAANAASPAGVAVAAAAGAASQAVQTATQAAVANVTSGVGTPFISVE